MKLNYILIIIATVLLAFDFVLQKKYQAGEGADISAGLKFNALTGLFTALIFFALSGFKAEFSLFSIVLAFLMSLFGMLYVILGFKILKGNGMAVYSLFLMSGGMLLPYLFGVLFLNEPLTARRIIGVLIILLAVILSNKTKFKLKVSFFLLCLSVFILNGFVSIISKCHQINTTFNPVSSTALVMYSGIGKFIFSSVALLLYKSKGKLSFSPKNTVFIVVGSALIGGVSYMLQLIGAKELPATVLYPIVTGGSIVFSALSGKVFFKEKLSSYQLTSIALCFVGTLLFL